MFTVNYSIHALVETIIVILNTRDPYTFEHSWRVSALSELIVRKMNISDEYEKAIHIAAHLHDIGKIGIPDYILNKPGKLTNVEYEKMKDHPEIGYEIVSGIENLKKIALDVRHHHERWDGKGYPSSLSGEDIPLGARIIAIADTFDAITSHRPYSRERGVFILPLKKLGLHLELSSVLKSVVFFWDLKMKFQSSSKRLTMKLLREELEIMR